jgi:hypothetical protein
MRRVLMLLAFTSIARTQPHADAESGALLEKARRAALSYTASLPDFICTQSVNRFEDVRGTNRWLLKDTLTVRLSYSGRNEDYKLTEINGKPTLLDFMNVGGPTTRGEFGTMLLLLFHPDTRAEFHRKGSVTFRKQRLAIFRYKIDREHSAYRVAYGAVDGPTSILAPYHGEVWVDPESGQIRHLSQEAELPIRFPISASSTKLDYDYADVGGRKYLLPARAEVGLTSGKYHGRNEVEFKDYRKFQTDATITFDKP